MRHVEDAQIGYKKRGVQGQDMFKERSFGELRYFEYLIDNVKKNALRLSKKISDQKKYDIKLNIKGTPKKIYGVRNSIQNTLDVMGIFHSISCSSKSSTMSIITNATEECLIGTLERYKSKCQDFKRYNIKRRF
tara:strand:- start:121 stop:522 length:402 start_codon:yes stop_codon:yes gene_type:complete